MKNASEYARHVKKMLNHLPRAEAKPHAPQDEVTGDLILALLRRHVSDSAAHTAYRKLRDATVNLNDLRVTPATDIAELLGAHFPDAAAAGESIARALVAIFNRCHNLDLAFLKNQGRIQAREFVESLDGVSRFSAALFCLRALGQHAVPLDERGLEWLKQQELVDPGATEVEAQGFLERTILPGQVEAFIAAVRAPAARKAAPEKEKKANHAPKAKAHPDASGDGEKGSTRGRSAAKRRPRRPASRRK